ncbi:MAG: prenyltransferase/squalene oxidase repeat-containing protein [Pirellulales bacterium]
MSWIEEIVGRLAEQPCCGYRRDTSPATEPTALAALALASHGRNDAAEHARQWLVQRQGSDGGVGISATDSTPQWPTGLAVLAWRSAGSNGDQGRYQKNIDRAIGRLLALKGGTTPVGEPFDHDTSLVGWPWVDGTHSWVEPTAIGLLALKATGHGQHARSREAVRLLLDRLLPDGGCNYGNVRVLGTLLRPHVEPSGLAMVALAGEQDSNGRVNRSLEYLRRQVSGDTTTASLCYGLMGLAAHGQRPKQADAWLESAGKRTLGRDGSPHRLALVALAALGETCPLLALTKKAIAS